MSYFNLVNPNIGVNKTIILKTPEECLKANSITKKLIEDGCQILPTVLFPNEIRISYIPPFDKYQNSETPKDNNIISYDSGKSFVFMN